MLLSPSFSQLYLTGQKILWKNILANPILCSFIHLSIYSIKISLSSSTCFPKLSWLLSHYPSYRYLFLTRPRLTPHGGITVTDNRVVCYIWNHPCITMEGNFLSISLGMRINRPWLLFLTLFLFPSQQQNSTASQWRSTFAFLWNLIWSLPGEDNSANRSQPFKQEWRE